jgi:hypothetical protein
MAEKKLTPRDRFEICKRAKKRGGPSCWALNADGELKEFLDFCIEMERKRGEYNREEALRQAQEFYGVKIKRNVFISHVTEQCSCDGQKKA